MAAAVGCEDESDEEDKLKGENQGDLDSDASSEFGLGGDGSKVTSRRKEKEKTTKPTKPQPPSQGTGRNTAAATGKGTEKSRSAIEEATKMLGTLAPFTPVAIWKASFKESEISGKLKKVSVMAASLSQQASAVESVELKNEMEGLATRMEKKVSEVGLVQETLGQFRNPKTVLPLLKDEELTQKLIEVCPVMDTETLSAFLLHVGVKLSEARLGKFVVTESQSQCLS